MLARMRCASAGLVFMKGRENGNLSCGSAGYCAVSALGASNRGAAILTRSDWRYSSGILEFEHLVRPASKCQVAQRLGGWQRLSPTNRVRPPRVVGPHPSGGHGASLDRHGLLARRTSLGFRICPVDVDAVVRALNRQGIFFESWALSTASRAEGWKVRSANFPVEHQAQDRLRARESSLDIRIESRSANEILTMLIECKRHHPDYANWVFFPKSTENVPSEVRLPVVDCPVDGDRWSARAGTRTVRTERVVAGEAREARENYQPGQTSTHAVEISEASYQVALAAHSVITDERRFAEIRATALQQPPALFRSHVLLPVIVTTARLFVARFNPSDVDAATGEIATKSVTLDPVESIYFEYPLPRHLHRGEHATLSDAEIASRFCILVIDSKALAKVLTEFAEGTSTLFVARGPTEYDPPPALTVEELRLRRALFAEVQFNYRVVWEAANQNRLGLLQRSAWHAASGLKLSLRVQGALEDAYAWGGAYEAAAAAVPPPGTPTSRDGAMRQAKTLAETSERWFEDVKQRLLEEEPQGLL